MIKHVKILLAATVAQLLAGNDQAFANHKSWILKNPGSNCSFTTPDPNLDGRDSSLGNGADVARFATCPVAVSGRWASSSGPVVNPAKRWANTMSGSVFVYNAAAGQTFSCQMVARLGSGSQLNTLYFSRTVSSSAFGNARLNVAVTSTWGSGSTLETNQALTVRSMDFQCRVPAGSVIFGYKVRPCMNPGNSECNSEIPPPGDDIDGQGYRITGGSGYNFVHTSGTECTPVAFSTNVTRNEFGVFNATSTGDLAEVFCPLIPPSDDSVENYRVVDLANVYFAGGNVNATCVADRTCPLCKLMWRDDRTQSFFWSTAFTPQQLLPTHVGQVAGNTVGLDLGIAVDCILWPGMRIQGVTARMSVNQVVEAN